MKQYQIGIVMLFTLMSSLSHSKNGEYVKEGPLEDVLHLIEDFNFTGTGIEALEGLFLPAELDVYYKLMDFDPEKDNPEDNPVRYLTLSYKIERTMGISYNRDYGYPTHEEYRNYHVKLGEIIRGVQSYSSYWSVNSPGIAKVSVNSDGHIVALTTKIDSDSDIELINSLPELQFLLVDFISPEIYHLDPNMLDLKKLRSFESTTYVTESAPLCQLPNISRLSFRGGMASSKVYLDNCSDTLTWLYTGTAIRDVSLKNIPNLQYLDTHLTADREIEIDFGTVPNIRALDPNKVPQVFSGIEKTNSLEFLGLHGTGSDIYADQFFGENVKYIDVSFSRYRNYSFLKKYPKLESLDLRMADFDEWELLPQLESIKHLSLRGIPVAQEALEYIAKMPNLQHLNLQETGLTDASDLTGLDTLNFLILPESITSPEGGSYHKGNFRYWWVK